MYDSDDEDDFDTIDVFDKKTSILDKILLGDLNCREKLEKEVFFSTQHEAYNEALEDFSKCLTPELERMFDDFVNTQIKLLRFAQEHCFTTGFKVGLSSALGLNRYAPNNAINIDPD